MENLTSKEAAEILNKLINYLKDQKINQAEIGERIHYTSLSKAKNYKSYPQKIIENKTRTELLSLILCEYKLEYIADKGTFAKLRDTDIVRSPTMKDEILYNLYYYSSRKGKAAQGILKIINKQRTELIYADPALTRSEWKGSYEVIENHTFILTEKQGESTPVKSLFSLFSGTVKYGRPILLGTYNSVKRDGFPTSGKLLLLKAENETTALQRLETETDPRIEMWLKNSNHTTETITPGSLDELSVSFLPESITGIYHCWFPDSNQEIQETSFNINTDGTASIQLFEHLLCGNISYADKKVLHLHLETPKNNLVHLILESFITYKKEGDPISALALIKGPDTTSYCLPILLTREKISGESLKNHFRNRPGLIG